MRKNENLTFGQWRRNENRKKEVNEASWFGLLAGLILTAVFGLRAICSTGLLKTIFMIPTVIGFVLFLLGGFNAPMLIPLSKSFRKAASFVGTFLLRVILLPIYLILFVFSLFGKKRIAKKYEFYSWNSSDSAPEASFLPYEHILSKPHRSALLGTLNSIFFVFAKNKQYILIPLVIILLMLGLVFFFLSSSSVFGFVYTLF